MKTTLQFTVASLLCWYTTACQQSSDQSTATNTPANSTQQAPATNQAPSSFQAENVATTASTAPAAAPKTQAINQQVNHPNGTTFFVKNVSINETSVGVDLSVTNGHNRTIQLNQSGKAFLLRDDLGNVYYVVPPINNEKVQVEPGKTLEGTFSFAGRLNPQAQKFSIVTNDKYGSTTADYTTDPKMSIEVAIPR